MSDTPETITLNDPATVMAHVDGAGRKRIRFDAGEHPLEHDDPHVAAATAELARVLARRSHLVDQVPDGSVDAVKDWVGDDPTRAAAALEVERARSQGPRSSLEPWLVGLVDPDDGGDAGATGDDQEA